MWKEVKKSLQLTSLFAPTWDPPPLLPWQDELYDTQVLHFPQQASVPVCHKYKYLALLNNIQM